MDDKRLIDMLREADRAAPPPATGPLDLTARVRARYRRQRAVKIMSGALAAVLALAVGRAVLLRDIRPSPAPLPIAAMPPSEEAQRTALADARRTVMRAGVAMQMLGAADFLAEQPGGREIARERLRYIIANYPETTAAAEARSRVASQPEWRT